MWAYAQITIAMETASASLLSLESAMLSPDSFPESLEARHTTSQTASASDIDGNSSASSGW